MARVIPTLGPIRRVSGVAGSYAYTVTVTYPGENPAPVTFTASEYGNPGPVLMLTPGFPGGVPVTDPARFGAKLTADWVRRFYA